MSFFDSTKEALSTQLSSNDVSCPDSEAETNQKSESMETVSDFTSLSEQETNQQSERTATEPEVTSLSEQDTNHQSESMGAVSEVTSLSEKETIQQAESMGNVSEITSLSDQETHQQAESMEVTNLFEQKTFPQAERIGTVFEVTIICDQETNQQTESMVNVSKVTNNPVSEKEQKQTSDNMQTVVTASPKSGPEPDKETKSEVTVAITASGKDESQPPESEVIVGNPESESVQPANGVVTVSKHESRTEPTQTAVREESVLHLESGTKPSQQRESEVFVPASESDTDKVYAAENELSVSELESGIERGEAAESEVIVVERESETDQNQLANVDILEPESCAELNHPADSEVTVSQIGSGTEEDYAPEMEATDSETDVDIQQDHLSENEETAEEVDRAETDQIQQQSTSSQTVIINRMPNYLSDGETNFLRFCHLVQKVAPQAVRHRFDQEFPPANLDTKIRSNLKTLTDLKKKKILTNLQWKLLLPYGSTAVSTDFDVTLMICLFRHLSSVTPRSGDYDTLPPPSDESLGADLARVKYYRNKISHSLEKDRIIDNFEFPIVWESLSKAVGRIGGQKYEHECVSLLVTNLDPSYMDICREFLMVESSLRERMKEMEKELKDPIPRNEKDQIDSLIQQWREVDKKFVETNGYKALRKALQTESVAIVTGSPESGKSSTAQHALLSLSSVEYDIIPVT